MHARLRRFDIFVMNQHSSSEIGGDLLLNLARSIEMPGKLLLLLDSWRDPAPLARCWCLYEIYTAIKCGASITMSMSRSEEHSFTGDLDANRGELEQLGQRIGAQMADATVAADKAMVFGSIAYDVGFEEFNRQLRSTVRGALEQAVMTARSPFKSTARGKTRQ